MDIELNNPDKYELIKYTGAYREARRDVVFMAAETCGALFVAYKVEGRPRIEVTRLRENAGGEWRKDDMFELREKPPYKYQLVWDLGNATMWYPSKETCVCNWPKTIANGKVTIRRCTDPHDYSTYEDVKLSGRDDAQK